MGAPIVHNKIKQSTKKSTENNMDTRLLCDTMFGNIMAQPQYG